MPWILHVSGEQRIHATVRMAIIVAWLLAFAAAGSTRAADSAPNNESASVERAVAMLKDGAEAEGREAIAILETLGYQGDARAQLLLGAIYFDGKAVPRDVVQSYAWLEVAATTELSAIANHAKKMLLANQAALSGGDLIRADQRAALIRSAMAERNYELFGAGVRQFTMERPVSFSPSITFGTELVQLTPTSSSQTHPDRRPGCAAAPTRTCPPNSKSIDGPRCTGRILQPDTGPSAVESAKPDLVAPDFPHKLRRRNFSGTAYIVVHVDRTGWICGAAIAASSGEPSWDAAVLTAVTLSRLKPAIRQGEAVEGLHMIAMSGRVE